MNFTLRKIKFSAILFLTLTSTIAIFQFLPKATAEVTIISINPTSGCVGANVTLIANITTVNGQYRIFFDERELQGGNATGNSVNASIVVPPARAGNHTIKIMDEETKENTTATFEVLTTYLLEISPPVEPPRQRQEGDSVEIHVNITGGEQDKQFYIANITVQTPNATYTNMFNITLSEDGSGGEIIKYPENFTGANTHYVGEYKVFFNETLATATFTIGLTNSTEYHRFQTVNIKAAGYQPNENVTITITGEKLHNSTSLNASPEGFVQMDWAVPHNASMGVYTVNITSTFGPTAKVPLDSQNFTVPGFDVNITARNLASEPVPQVTFRIFEGGVSITNVTSGSGGLATVKLEIGNFTVEAYFKERKTGESWINVTETSLSFNITCNLASLKVLVLAVVNDKEFCVPEVELSLSPENLTLTPTLTTNIDGVAVFRSLLADVTYTLNASRFGMQFNTTTIPGLLQNGNPVAWFNLTITCPNYTLKVNVTNPNANNQPISSAAVKVQDLLGGLFFEETTAEDGVAEFNCPFGRYAIKVYVDDIKLNETMVNLNEPIVNVLVNCRLYGLSFLVQVVDYFGQPISNANVTLQRDGSSYRSNLTESDGIAKFPNIIGGTLRAVVYLPGQSQPYMETTFYVDGSKTVQVRVERYVVIAGFIVETGQLATTLIVVVSVILVLIFEFYRRRRLKPKTGGSES
ncbi:MAG: carboxypeptidase-like regulatory domain-containing protein [Candidatus Bathyarchaeia archaeon]